MRCINRKTLKFLVGPGKEIERVLQNGVERESVQIGKEKGQERERGEREIFAKNTFWGVFGRPLFPFVFLDRLEN